MTEDKIDRFVCLIEELIDARVKDMTADAADSQSGMVSWRLRQELVKLLLSEDE